MKRCFHVLTTALVAACLTAGYAFALDVLPGVDLFETPPGGLTEVHVTLPADFFGPGSDPFDGTVALRGKALEPTTGHSLGRTSTVVRRLATATLPGPGSSDIIPIEIVALRLVSIQPIEVTYGGLNPEPWDVGVSLSCVSPQTTGDMEITQEYDGGGTYSANLPVTARMTYTRQDDGTEVVEDPMPLEIMETPLVPPLPDSAAACWSYSVPFPIVESTGLTAVQTDCGSVPIGPSSNFVAGGCGFTAGGLRPDPSTPPVTYQKVTSQEQALYAKHGIQPANPLDHFKVYRVFPTIPVGYAVTLQDQFDPTEETGTLNLIDHFANPVDKNSEGIGDINAHLIWYRYIHAEFPETLRVVVNNQFGEQVLKVGIPEYLLVPAEKIEPGSEFPYMLDHYKVYPVLNVVNVNQTGVTLDDQFHGEVVDVTEAIWFANPVDKNGEGIIDDVDHLVFYDINPKDVPPITTVDATDQFNTYVLPIDSCEWLGVPSEKVEWGPWEEGGIPTLSEWGMIALALLLLAAAALVIRRRRLQQA